MFDEMVPKGERAITANGFDITTYGMAPDSATGTLAGFIEKLKTEEWDEVFIGHGVKTDPRMTVWFEELINVVREHSPKSKFVFNETDQDTLVAMKRVFPPSS
ncbi:hypothetical protein FRB94_006539 [Tulasnella sp. JGI-2019a]|nr:hypothetical protein FRB93_012120 [Tulasnella sp. JGI-2019a]KAG9012171.1 hypothetical protein FRB94_006539 [Tulasnella sp. JGI-2019a]KAG9036369.1 hypothetical protein FRB95_009291 [Tulasnella sp. JGI-2019a]